MGFIFILIEMRQVGSSRGVVIVYFRQFELLIRLVEVYVRMRLLSKVENVDVEEVRRYFIKINGECDYSYLSGSEKN